MAITKQDVLDYHEKGRPGKIEVVPTKPLNNQRHLSLAYSPGVAEAVLEVEAEPNNAYRYTAKRNLVAVISNGSAILGLGNRGALASKPVMEGKGVLFKSFADIDVFDIEIDSSDPDEIVQIVKGIAPTFGGINLEDIKAPECFYIERALKELVPIPVFHDDQHGTAIISSAALINACAITNRRLEDIQLVVIGAGASALASADLYVKLGVQQENITILDSRGVVHAGRADELNEYKLPYAKETDKRTLEDALQGADVMLGLAQANIVTPEMIASMAPDPIIFALSNPDPEIDYDLAKQTRPDAIIGTGRSDYPNQVNNVLGFPYIFRGALDVGAMAINDEMKIAAVEAIAALAQEDVPDSVLAAYQLDSLSFGPEYLIPKPLDDRAMVWISSAVAQAAMESGVARMDVNLDEYRDELIQRQGSAQRTRRFFINKARRNPKRIVFGEGNHRKIIRAAAQILDQGIGYPILIGDPDIIGGRVEELVLDFEPTIVNPKRFSHHQEYVDVYYGLRKRKGVTHAQARERMTRPSVLAPMMLHMGDADCYLAGVAASYPEIIRPALQIFGTHVGASLAAGLYLVLAKGRVYVFSDTTVNINPSEEQLAEIAILAHDFARSIELEPIVAMLSFSNFGSSSHAQALKVQQATRLVQEMRPDIQIDGEVQADFAVDPEIIEVEYPFSQIRGANVLIFPELSSANMSYKLLDKLGEVEMIGPILVGMGAPVHVLQQADSVEDIVAMAAVAVMDAQRPPTFGY